MRGRSRGHSRPEGGGSREGGPEARPLGRRPGRRPLGPDGLTAARRPAAWWRLPRPRVLTPPGPPPCPEARVPCAPGPWRARAVLRASSRRTRVQLRPPLCPGPDLHGTRTQPLFLVPGWPILGQIVSPKFTRRAPSPSTFGWGPSGQGPPGRSRPERGHRSGSSPAGAGPSEKGLWGAHTRTDGRARTAASGGPPRRPPTWARPRDGAAVCGSAPRRAVSGPACVGGRGHGVGCRGAGTTQASACGGAGRRAWRVGVRGLGRARRMGRGAAVSSASLKGFYCR